MSSPTAHYIQQRYSAVMLWFLSAAVLGIVFGALYCINCPPFDNCCNNLICKCDCCVGYDHVLNTVKCSCVATVLFLFITIGLYHGYLGIQTIAKDYIQAQTLRHLVLIAVSFVFLFFAVSGMFSLTKIVTATNNAHQHKLDGFKKNDCGCS